MRKIYQLLSSRHEQQTENTLDGALLTAQGLADTYGETITVSEGTPIPGTYMMTWRHVCDVKPTNQ